MAECQLPKLDVAGSNPVGRSNNPGGYGSPVTPSVSPPPQSESRHQVSRLVAIATVACCTRCMAVDSRAPQRYLYGPAVAVAFGNNPRHGVLRGDRRERATGRSRLPHRHPRRELTRRPAPRGWSGFRQQLGQLGYVEGLNFALIARFAHGKAEQLTPLAEELVRLKLADHSHRGRFPGNPRQPGRPPRRSRLS